MIAYDVEGTAHHLLPVVGGNGDTKLFTALKARHIALERVRSPVVDNIAMVICSPLFC
jgi:hypothetical protein